MKTSHATTDNGQRDFFREHGEFTVAPLLTRDYLAANRMAVDFPKRFKAKIQMTESGCWVWEGCKVDGAYGQISRGKPFKGMILAHRAAWILNRGAILEGLDVLHRCDTPACCRPDHLFLGTHSTNMMDKKLKGRGTAGRIGVSHKLGNELNEIRDLVRHRIFSQAQIAVDYGITRQRVSQVAQEVQQPEGIANFRRQSLGNDAPSTRERDAFHESSHAVVATLLHIAVDVIELIPGGSNPSAKFRFGQVRRDQHDLIPVVCMAGRIGELTFDPSADPRPRQKDMLVAKSALRGRLDLLFPAARQAYLQACELEATKIVAANWQTITALAAELLAKGRLTGPEITEFVKSRIAGQPDTVKANA